MTKPKALAYSYIRFSNPEQARGDSLRRQTELRDAWLDRNQVALDSSLTLEDKGVSGFTGRHRTNPDRHALAAFLKAVEAGKVPRGSYLIVENLDRLSREDIIPALSLLLDLIQAGIRVVQLLPTEAVYDEKANPMQVMMAIMELSRGHSESAAKSARNGAAWREKKQLAAREGKPVTARAPAWLRLVDGKWELDEAAASAVRRIFRMLVEGYGLHAITKKLNAEGVPAIGPTGCWLRGYISKIVKSRTVVGEYQPRKGHVERAPDGDPIPGYFPALITEEEWYAAQAALASRRRRPGRPARDFTNLFTGLLHDARDGGALHMITKKVRRLVSHRALSRVAGAHHVAFPLDTFEAAILSCLREIDPAEILTSADRGADQTLPLAGRLAELQAEVEKVKARLQARYSDAVADVLERHEAEAKVVAAELAQARQQAASPLSEAWGEFPTLLDALKAAPDPEAARLRLRSALRRIAGGIWCLFVDRGGWRLAAVQIYFTGGARRDYLILHRHALAGRAAKVAGLKKRRPAQWSARSMADVPGSTDLDLRRRDHARRLEKALLALDLSAIE
jgi:DNA invertase Pin-like site-specific DNA recombinase